MKSEKGITLMSLIIYIIAMCIVVSILASMSSFFFTNTKTIKEDSKYIAEYNKFNMYFLEDVKNNKDTILVTDNEIRFADGTIYTFKPTPDSSVYRNKVKICSNIIYCTFDEKRKVDDPNKKIITVHMVVRGNKIFETINDYVLKYW